MQKSAVAENSSVALQLSLLDPMNVTLPPSSPVTFINPDTTESDTPNSAVTSNKPDGRSR